MIGNPLTQLLAQQEAFARAACVEYECNQVTIPCLVLLTTQATVPYQPYKALNRL